LLVLAIVTSVLAVEVSSLEKPTFILTSRNAAVDWKFHVDLNGFEGKLVALVSRTIRSFTATIA
jgi:hypothetical protein